MDSQQFYRVMSLFQEACHLEGAERAAFLDQNCAGDEKLRGEVEAMLEVDANPVQPVDIAGAGAHLLAAHIAEEDSRTGATDGRRADRQLVPLANDLFAGQYRIIRQIGEGGMGTVYEAEQTRPKRIVALKLIRQGAQSSGALRRFEHEAHILGRLQHPGIAQIYEAGFDEGPRERQAYIAMEFVPGRTLIEYSNANSLTPSQRLELMIKVCDALQHAHQRGVIHRDLKPGNILVVGEESESTSNHGSRSSHDHSVSRLHGPAPKILDFGVARTHGDEQALTTMHTVSGQIVGTLAYMSPEQVGGDPGDIDIRSDIYAIGVILYQLLSGRMPYDLRAKSIPEAAMMIRDHEAPTLSSIDTNYRGDIETIVAKAMQKDRERRYQSAAELAEDIRRHLAGEPIGAKRDSALYVLKKQLRRYRLLVAGVAVVAMIVVISSVWLSLMYQRQGHLLKEAELQYRRALDASKLAAQRLVESNLLRDKEQRARNRAEKSAIRAESINSFLQDMMASADPRLARGAELTVRELLDDSARRMDAGAFDDQPEVEAQTRVTIGESYRRLGKYTDAEQHFRRALEINRKLSPGDALYTADALAQLAELERLTGRLNEADQHAREVLDMLGRIGGGSRIYGAALNVRGMVEMNRANFPEAETLFRECIARLTAVYGDRHVEVAGMMQNLGVLYMRMGRTEDAQSMIEKSVAIFSETLGPDHPYVALGLNNLGALAFARQDFDTADEFLLESMHITDKYYGEETPEMINALVNRGTLRDARGDKVTAEALFCKALTLQKKVLKPRHPDIADVLSKLGLLQQEQGRMDDAEANYRESLSILKETFGPNHPEVADQLSNLASILADRGDDAESEKMQREALRIRREKLPSGHRDISSSLGMLASLLIRREEYKEAEALMRECLEIRREQIPNHWLYGSAMTKLAMALAGQGKFEEAESEALRGWQTVDAMAYAPALYKQDALLVLVTLYDEWGKTKIADQWREKLDEIKSAAAGDHTSAP